MCDAASGDDCERDVNAHDERSFDLGDECSADAGSHITDDAGAERAADGPRHIKSCTDIGASHFANDRADHITDRRPDDHVIANEPPGHFAIGTATDGVQRS